MSILRTVSPEAFDDEKQAKRIKAVQEDAPRSVGLYARAYRGTAGPKSVIKAICLECISLKKDEIARCTEPECPLWPYRPYQEASQHNMSDAVIDERRTAQLEKVRKTAPGKVVFFQRAYSGKASPRKAIKAYCIKCCLCDEKSIQLCPSTICPAWGYRPYQKVTPSKMANPATDEKSGEVASHV